ncbi:MAG: peptide chain release factor N(5)-glutamine methyltransferase [Verrucomicrobiales bacterium]
METLQRGTEYLEKRGVPDARLNMQLMLAHQLECTKLDLYLQFDRPLEEPDLVPLREMLRRRGLREPLQHVIGKVEFAGHEFKSDERALIPRPETEELVGRLIKEPPSIEPGQRVVDVGTGSGIIGLSLANAWKDRGLEFVLVDVEDAALALAQENAIALELESSVQLVQSDLLESAPGPYHLIVANLPYIAHEEMVSLSPEVLKDPHSALDGGPGGLQLVERLIEQSNTHLSAGGRITLEIGAGQADATMALFSKDLFENITKETDLSGIERFVSASKIL